MWQLPRVAIVKSHYEDHEFCLWSIEFTKWTMVKRGLLIEIGLYRKVGDGQIQFSTLVEVNCGYHPLQTLGSFECLCRWRYTVGSPVEVVGGWVVGWLLH